jgi:hypothetical protein
MKNLFRPALLLATGAFALASCSKDDDTTAVAPAAQAQTVNSLSAAGTASATGQPIPAKHYTFFSLADNKQIAYTDSNSTKWDVAFRGTNVLTNGGTSGPGQGGAQVYTGTFESLTTAPTTGYTSDATAALATAGWYSYNATTHVVTPVAGRILTIRTATGKYAKLEVMSYYQNAPAAPTSASPSGYYTFRYVYQPSGTSLK